MAALNHGLADPKYVTQMELVFGQKPATEILSKCARIIEKIEVGISIAPERIMLDRIEMDRFVAAHMVV